MLKRGYRLNKDAIEEVRRKIEIIKLVFSLLYTFLFTAFTLVLLIRKWGSSVYLYLILGLAGIYIIVFTALIVYIKHRGGAIKTHLKDYQSGLKIFKYTLTLISLGLTASVFSLTLFSDANTFFQAAVMIISLLWTLFQFVYQIVRVAKRHKKKGRKTPRRYKRY